MLNTSLVACCFRFVSRARLFVINALSRNRHPLTATTVDAISLFRNPQSRGFRATSLVSLLHVFSFKGNKNYHLYSIYLAVDIFECSSICLRFAFESRRLHFRGKIVAMIDCCLRYCMVPAFVAYLGVFLCTICVFIRYILS